MALQVRGVKLSRRAVARRYFDIAPKHELGLKPLKLVVRGGSKFVFDRRVRVVRVRLVRHVSTRLGVRLEKRNHVRCLNVAAHKGLDDGIGFRFKEDAFQAVVGIGLTHDLATAQHLCFVDCF